MSHLVFARKYRPQNFTSIVGQEHVTKALVNAISRNKVPHALLFNGPRGVGKTTSARVLAKALNCTGRELPKQGENFSSAEELIDRVEPCGTCPNCVEITRGSNLAVVEIDGASNNSVENVRNLIETLLTAPPPNIKYKIYIIDEVHMLSTAAFNALLKTLEEPPPNTIFILATTEPHKIPDTVISRCQQHDFRRFTLKDLKKQMKQICELENIEVDPEVLTLIAKRCEGGMRDASSLLERIVAFSDGKVDLIEASKTLGVYGFQHFIKLVEQIVLQQKLEVFELIDQAFSGSLDLRSYFSDLVSTFRLVALYSLAAARGQGAINALIISEELSEVEVESLNEVSKLSNTDSLFQLYDLSREISDIALKSEFPKFALEAGAVKLASISNLISLAELVDGLSSGKVGTAQKKNNLNLDFKGISSGGTSPTPSQSIPKIREADKVQKNETKIEEVEDKEQNKNEFVFIWGDFLNFLKKGGHIRLDTYLKRVAPKLVSCNSLENSGVFQVVAPKFVYDAFVDPEIIQELKNLLIQFSLVQNWKITFEVHAETASEKTNIVPARKQTHGSSHSHVPGSFEGKTQEKRATKIKSIEEQAKDDELVKKTLSVFSGSVIEKITPTMTPTQKTR